MFDAQQGLTDFTRNTTTTTRAFTEKCRPYRSHIRPPHLLNHTEDVIKGLNNQRAIATIYSRAEVKPGPCAQLFEAGS